MNFFARLVHATLLLSLLTAAEPVSAEPSPAEQGANAGGSIAVFPSVINVSRDYPGRFVATEILSDGSTVDRTREVASLLAAANNSEDVLQIDADGTLRLNSNSLVHQIDAVTLSTRIADQSVEVAVRINDTESRSPTFPREISALMGKAGCNLGTCHGNLHGKGGFRLSLRGDDPELDYNAIVRGDSARRIDAFAPELSLLLTKPSGQFAHQGGVRFDVGSNEYELLRRWINDGCRWNAEASTPTAETRNARGETLARLEVFPARSMLAPIQRSQQLVVTATFVDGTTRDVTNWARFEPSLVADVSVSANGWVTADKPLDVSISVSYLSGRTASRLTFLPEHSVSESLDVVQAAKSQQVKLQHFESQPLDAIVDQQLQRMRLHASAPADDNVFLRRVYLVLVGRLPTVEEAREFLVASHIDKRERLIERLLNDSGYAALWAMRWSDLLRNEQKVMSPAGAQGWHDWMVEQISNDRPLNEFVAEMITTIGSTYDHPPASFHRTHRDPETAAESIGQVFLGVRLQCARCHNHPFDKWRQDDYYGLAAYFTTLERKQVDNAPKDKFDKHIISGDEVVSLNNKSAAIMHPGRASNVPPKPLTETYSTDADGNTIASTVPGLTPLESLADWLTNDNRLFARNMANRVWYHLMGRGVVDPPDDFRDSNPASNPELLEYLTDEFIRSGYSVRHLSRLILYSQTFARAAVDDVHVQGLDAEANFAGYPLRRMSAEVLMDALSDVTQVASRIDEQTSAPTSKQRAIVRSEVPGGSGFLSTFGKPNRLLICECERSNAVSLGQSLMLVNGADMRSKLAESRNRITTMLASNRELTAMLDDLYIATLTRPASTTELEKMVNYIEHSASPRAALEDILWALINSQEFALIR